MPTPQFILDLRAKVGHDPLPLHGVTAVVLDDDQRVLLVRRADNGQWALVTGCLEPGEQPAAGALREIEEETGVIARAERLLSVKAMPLRTFVNGDQAHVLNVAFRQRLPGLAHRSCNRMPTAWVPNAVVGSRSGWLRRPRGGLRSRGPLPGTAFRCRGPREPAAVPREPGAAGSRRRRAPGHGGRHMPVRNSRPGAILTGMSSETPRIPAKPSLDGLEDKWTQRWAKERVVQV